jgi:hypothetical protein
LGAGVLYVVLAFAALVRAISASASRGVRGIYASALASVLSAGIVLHVIDRSFSEAVFMKAVFWLLLGLTVGVVNRSDPEEPAS